jgi:hypothetical protein
MEKINYRARIAVNVLIVIVFITSPVIAREKNEFFSSVKGR